MDRGAGLLIEGYASLFGVEDLAGDVVRAGAFARSLARGGGVPMLLQHRGGQVAGVWTRIREDGRGLFARGLVTGDTAAGQLAMRMAGNGEMSGLSIGFIAREWSAKRERGRDLKAIELREISLVSEPMAPAARFRVLTSALRSAA